MAHVTKLTAGAIAGLANHCERKSDKHSNKMIDIKKTHLNYALDNNENPREYFNKRLGEVRINQRRDDIKVAASWVITQPRDIAEEESRKFFEAAHNFLAKKYGEKNVIWSRVHMDETTPHLHFCFMPVTQDKKHEGEEKVCAKDVLNRKSLMTFHKELASEMRNVFGREIGIETGKTLNNLEMEKLKVKSALDKTAEDLTTEISKKKQELSEVNARVKSVQTAQQIAAELQDGASAVLLSRHKRMSVHESAYKDALAYLQTESEKEKTIDELGKQLEEANLTIKIANERAQKSEQQREFVVRERDKLQNEFYAVKNAAQEAEKIVSFVQSKSPELVRQAREFRKGQERGGRGLSR